MLTKVLHQQLASGHDGLLGFDRGIAILQSLPGGRIEEADAVMVADTGLTSE